MSKWLLTPTELDSLETLLELLPEELDLSLPTLHGIVTGLAVLPIQPDHNAWSTLTLHNTDPLGTEQKTWLFGVLNEWHQRVDRVLQSGETFELPVDLSSDVLLPDSNEAHPDPLEEDSAPPSDIEEWCIGFIEAIVTAEQLDSTLGERAEEITEISIPAAFIAGVLDGTEWDEVYDKDDIMIDLLSALPDMVSDLYLALRVQVVENNQ